MKLTGIASWAFLTKPKASTKFKNGIIPSMYTVNLMLDVKTAKKLKAEGFNVKKNTVEIPGIENAVGKPYLQIKKGAEYEGKPTKPPEVFDSKLQPFTGLIGNGSKISVIFAAREWESMGQTGTAASLRKVQVLELVEYGSDEDLESFEEEDGGFVTSASSAKATATSAKEESFDDEDDDLAF